MEACVFFLFVYLITHTLMKIHATFLQHWLSNFQHQRITTAKLNTKVKNKRKIPAGLTLMSPQLWALTCKRSPSRLPDHVFIKIKNWTAFPAQGQETIFCGLQKVKAKPCVIGRSVYLFLPIITHTVAHKSIVHFTSASL